MNSFAKFQQKVAVVSAGTSSSSSAVKSVANKKVNDSKPNAPSERILTVTIKTMRTHIRDDRFNNVYTLLEVFAEVHKILPPEGKIKEYRVTLKSLGKEKPHFLMQAVYFGDACRIQRGAAVRCIGRLIGQTGQFRILDMKSINLDDEMALIHRLEAICNFELSKMLSNTKK